MVIAIDIFGREIPVEFIDCGRQFNGDFKSEFKINGRKVTSITNLGADMEQRWQNDIAAIKATNQFIARVEWRDIPCR